MEKCKCCKNLLIENKNHSIESYEVDICDDCFDSFFGYCDQCGKLMQYHDKMLDGQVGISCKNCLEKIKGVK